MNNSSFFFLILSFIILLSLSSQRELKFPFTTEKVPSSVLTSFLQIPKTQVKDSGLDRDCIEACLGTPPQCFKLIIQTGSFYIWVVDPNNKNSKAVTKFDPKKSSSLERNMTEVLAEYSDSSVVGYQGKDYLTLEGEKIAKVNFLISKRATSFTEYEGMIGLGYTPNSYEEKFSLIEQLFINKVIFHRVFTQSFETSGRGEISIGEIPQYIVDDYQNYGRCKALNKIKQGQQFRNKNWQCELKGVYYGNSYSDFITKKMDNSKVSFFSYRRRALIPMKFFEYLEETYFKELIEKDICESTLLKRYDTFLCNMDYKPDIDLNFIYGDWAMRIPADKLFKINKKKNKLEFIFSHKKDYEKFTLGRPIVKLFHMVYDYQNEQIGFYSKTNVIRIATAKPTKPKVYKEIKEDKGPTVAPKPETKPGKQNPTVNTGNGAAGVEGEIKGDGEGMRWSSIMKNLLTVFVVLGVVFLFALSLYSFIKYRRKKRLNGSLLYNQF